MKPQRLRVGAYALLHDTGRILLCRVSPELPRWAGCWTLPGGGLEFGESPEQAVIREVEEETGLLIEVGAVASIDSIFESYATHDFQALRIVYHAVVTGGVLRPEASGSTDRCEWHPLHSGPSLPLGDLGEMGIRLAQRGIGSRTSSH
jgi:ADP-ribose pyrophosphatase YjhB (NUDIX family)